MLFLYYHSSYVYLQVTWIRLWEQITLRDFIGSLTTSLKLWKSLSIHNSICCNLAICPNMLFFFPKRMSEYGRKSHSQEIIKRRSLKKIKFPQQFGSLEERTVIVGCRNSVLKYKYYAHLFLCVNGG